MSLNLMPLANDKGGVTTLKQWGATQSNPSGAMAGPRLFSVGTPNFQM
jgi:hypothetical protein